MDHEQSADEKLREAILTRLAEDPRTVHADLRVGVLNGIAHLIGAVASLEIYDLASELAGSVRGVRAVVNRVDAPGAPSPARMIDLNLPAAPETMGAAQQDHDPIEHR